MIMEIYKDHIAPNPFDHKVVFPNVTELFTSIDFNEIVDNVGAGSIQWVYQKKIQIEGKKSYLYTINLCGGQFSIYSDKIKINRIR